MLSPRKHGLNYKATGYPTHCDRCVPGWQAVQARAAMRRVEARRPRFEAIGRGLKTGWAD